MEKFLILFSVVAGVLFIKEFKNNDKNKMQKNFVAWCFSSKYSCGIPLSSTIHNIQIALNIPEAYRLCDDKEWAMVEDILDGFKGVILHRFFSDNLDLPKSKTNHNLEEQWFMYLLRDFLEKHQCESSFLGHSMHKAAIDFKSYGSWGGELFDATYEITDFAVAFHKLYYISFIYCHNGETINPKTTLDINKKTTEEVIRTRTISISRY